MRPAKSLSTNSTKGVHCHVNNNVSFWLLFDLDFILLLLEINSYQTQVKNYTLLSLFRSIWMSNTDLVSLHLIEKAHGSIPGRGHEGECQSLPACWTQNPFGILVEPVKKLLELMTKFQRFWGSHSQTRRVWLLWPQGGQEKISGNGKHSCA